MAVAAAEAASRDAAAAEDALLAAERAAKDMSEEAPKARSAAQGTGEQNQASEEEQGEDAEEEEEVQLTHRRERPKGKKEAPKDKKKKKKKGNERPAKAEGFALNLDREQVVKSSFAVVMLLIWIYCGYSWVTSMLDSDEGEEAIVFESIY